MRDKHLLMNVQRRANAIFGYLSGLRFCLSAFLIVLISQTNVSAAENQIRIVAFGDSLTAGYGLDATESFPAQLEAELRARGHDVEIVNAGVSGDTASGGLARFTWTMSEQADGVILELGANDALRGVDPAVTRDALDRMLARLKERGVPVLLAGMQAPLNMGRDYASSFNPIYEELAAKHEVLLYPFFLDGVAAHASLNQSDGMHPTGEGVAEIVRRIMPRVEALLALIETRKTAPSRG
ncbi:MAG: arylesterase [Fimbriimonadaceae bacterium]|nr:arylesterase [Alphaproteobacteria bacterium]